jgi:hypothetical protein
MGSTEISKFLYPPGKDIGNFPSPSLCPAFGGEQPGEGSANAIVGGNFPASRLQKFKSFLSQESESRIREG